MPLVLLDGVHTLITGYWGLMCVSRLDEMRLKHSVSAPGIPWSPGTLKIVLDCRKKGNKVETAVFIDKLYLVGVRNMADGQYGNGAIKPSVLTIRVGLFVFVFVF